MRIKIYISLSIFFLSIYCFSFLGAQNCEPIADNSKLAKTPHPIGQIMGINGSIGIEDPNSIYTLDDLDEVCSFVRFFYHQDKDYQQSGIQHIPKDFSLGNRTKSELVDAGELLFANFDRIAKLKATGLKVSAAIEINSFPSGGKDFPNKWWQAGELADNPTDFGFIQGRGADWATAFLKVYDPKDLNDNFIESNPFVDILELGNEPWGYPGKDAYRYYIRGMLDAFKAYYDPNNIGLPFRIKLSGAAFQAHEEEGTLFLGTNLLDYVGDMIGHSELSELRGYLTEGIGVHNYSTEEHCNLQISFTAHPEKASGGFQVYKNLSTWVNNNMPLGTRKVNATEFGWNSDDEPKIVWECITPNSFGGCDSTNFGNIINVLLPAYRYDFNNNTPDFSVPEKRGIGRTTQAAYLVRSMLLLNRWGANQGVIYQLTDDWTNDAFYSCGLLDTKSPQNLGELGLNDLNKPNGKKESWYAIKKLKEELGNKYFLKEYGGEIDGEEYSYVYGSDDDGDGTAQPSHLVVWRAININKEFGEGVINQNNSDSNIDFIENETENITFSDLNLPSGITINTAGMATYLDGKTTTTDSQKPVSQIFDGVNIKASAIPLVIPLHADNACSINYTTGIVSNCGNGGNSCAGQGGDSDGDGVCDNQDNCDFTPNPDQADNDGDGIGNVCDATPNGSSGGNTDCTGLQVIGGTGSITISAISVGSTILEYNGGAATGWNWIGICSANCGNQQTVTGLEAGQYTIKAQNFAPYCYFEYEVTVIEGGNNPCDSQGGDSDGDGVCNNTDNCLNTANADQADNDGDGIGNVCDDTPNGIGGGGTTYNCSSGGASVTVNGKIISLNITDNNIAIVKAVTYSPDYSETILCTDYGSLTCSSGSNSSATLASGTYEILFIGGNCPTISNVQIGGSGSNPCDGQGGDSDGDGVCNNTDNCPNTANADQADNDGDGIGNVCDPTPNGTGGGGSSDCNGLSISGANSKVTISNIGSSNAKLQINGTGTGWAVQTICDGNCGSTQTVNNLPLGNYTIKAETYSPYCYKEYSVTITSGGGGGNPCANQGGDSDGDGVCNNTDNCPNTANADQADNDGDGIGNVCDPTPNGSGGGGTTYTDCSGTTITANASSIEADITNSNIAYVKVMNQSYGTIGYICNSWSNPNCNNGLNNSINVSAATYRVQVSYLNGPICEISSVVVGGNSNKVINNTGIVLSSNASNQVVQIEWVASKTDETESFTIEKSQDGIHFEPIKVITNNLEADYFKNQDENPEFGNNYYRIKQQFTSGEIQYSPIRKEAFYLDENTITLYPNPAKEELWVNLGAYSKLSGNVSIYNMLGQKVTNKVLNETNKQLRFNISDYQNGLYYLTIEAKGKRSVTNRFVVENWR
jgi:hypothetical protein